MMENPIGAKCEAGAVRNLILEGQSDSEGIVGSEEGSKGVNSNEINSDDTDQIIRDKSHSEHVTEVANSDVDIYCEDRDSLSQRLQDKPTEETTNLLKDQQENPRTSEVDKGSKSESFPAASGNNLNDQCGEVDDLFQSVYEQADDVAPPDSLSVIGNKEVKDPDLTTSTTPYIYDDEDDDIWTINGIY